MTTVAAADAIDPALEAIAAGVVLTAASADVPSDSSDGARTHAADVGWALQTDDQNFSFHFDQDIDANWSVRLTKFGGAAGHTMADSDGDAVVTLASGPAIELQHDPVATPAVDHFPIDHGQIHAGAGGATATGDPAAAPAGHTIEQASFMAENAVASSQHAEHGVDHPGNGANPPQSQHHTPAGHSVSSDDSLHSQSNPSSHSQSNPTNAGSGNKPAPGETGPAQAANAPGHDDSFHFKNEIAASNHVAAAVDQPAVGHGASVAHGHDATPAAPAAVLEKQLIALSAAEHPSAGHGHGLEAHVANHGSHDLIV